MRRFDRQVAVITGGATGIGLAAARRMASEGATVVLAGRDAERGRQAVQVIQDAGGEATFIPTDVADDRQVADLAEQAGAVHGTIDVWFNNAGVEVGAGQLDAFDDAALQQLLDTNVKGVYSGMRYAAERMGDSGVIINTASFVGTVTSVPIAVAYGGTKAAVASMSRAAALALADRQIEVFAICPYIVDTPMVDRLTGGQGTAAREAFAAQFAPSGRLTQPDEVAEVVADLAGHTSPFRSGQVLLVDAGPTVEPMP